jgi:hypothetical protein
VTAAVEGKARQSAYRAELIEKVAARPEHRKLLRALLAAPDHSRVWCPRTVPRAALDALQSDLDWILAADVPDRPFTDAYGRWLDRVTRARESTERREARLAARS